MIGLDTNVLIRYLTQDDPKQSATANHFIKKSVSHGENLWIGLITLCETVWVLERAYSLSKSEITEVLRSLLSTKQIQFQEKDSVWQALGDFEESRNVSFSDCLIGRQNLSHECSHTYTFDKEAAKKLTTFHFLK
jgi:predicted nucleic-acid-binding protein